jgi:hypothetical protein
VSLYTVDLREMWPLLAMLLERPESSLHARFADWKYPVTREWMRLTDLADIQRQQGQKRRVKPLERPWPDKSVVRKGGRKKNQRRSLAEVRRLLRGE